MTSIDEARVREILADAEHMSAELAASAQTGASMPDGPGAVSAFYTSLSFGEVSALCTLALERLASRQVVVVSQAASDVLAERERQVTAEGWTPEHDDEHRGGQMALAAACYAAPHAFPGKSVPHHWTDDSRYMDAQSEPVGEIYVPEAWPWDGQWFKLTGDPRRDLVKAGALILAEIERLDRALSHTRKPEGETR